MCFQTRVSRRQIYDGSTEDMNNIHVELHSKYNAEASRTVLSSLYMYTKYFRLLPVFLAPGWK